MSILVDRDTRLLVHGITTRKGRSCAEHMLANGTQIVAGVEEGQGGMWVAGVPVFDSVKETVAATNANAAVLCMPADQVCEAMLEEIDAGIELTVCLTSSVPVWDMVLVRSFIRNRPVHLHDVHKISITQLDHRWHVGKNFQSLFGIYTNRKQVLGIDD